MRDMLFIRHANHEDNDFARWLALRLAAEGYPVCCDLTQLLGGEDFRTDIERPSASAQSQVLVRAFKGLAPKKARSTG